MVSKNTKNKRWVLAEGIVELKFEPNVPQETLLGLLYADLIKRYPTEMKKLPILQMPDMIRNSDPNLKYVPYYQFSNENFILELGPRVILIKNHPSASGENYKGWESSYKKEISFIMGLIKSHNFVKGYERTGVRYVNFFEGLDVFSKIQPRIDLSSISGVNTFLGTQTKIDGFDCNIKIIAGAKVINPNFQGDGSIIDIDVSTKELRSNSDILQLLDSEHNILEDLLFKKILEKKYIESTIKQ